jgi:hypothetical protein
MGAVVWFLTVIVMTISFSAASRVNVCDSLNLPSEVVLTFELGVDVVGASNPTLVTLLSTDCMAPAQSA